MADDPKLWVALITGVLALLGTIYATVMSYMSRQEQDEFKAATDEKLAELKAEKDQELARLNAELQAERDRRQAASEAEKIVGKFREPLMHAAYDLQSRIFNILKGGFLPRYYTSGTAREREYAVENTVFLLAQFLGWTELVRQEIQFLDLGREDLTRELRRLQDSLYSQLQTDQLGPGFRLFAGEQRAVGELMIDRVGVVPRCIGFAAFLQGRNPAVDRWLDPLRDDIKAMATNLKPFENRLVQVQHALINILEFLDPAFVRFPRESRTKI
jgi:hypothetical protein